MAVNLVIYKTTNLINKKIYVGQDSKNNPKYLGSGKYLHNAIRKYGRKNFYRETLAWCDTKDKLDFLEKFYIRFCNSKIPNGYNISDGGTGFSLGHKVTKEMRRKISKNQIGKVVSEETRKRQSESLKGRQGYWKGKIRSKESNKKTSRKLKGRKLSETHKMNLKRPHKIIKLRGPHLETTKEKIRRSITGHIPTEETRKKMSESHMGKPNPSKGTKRGPYKKRRILKRRKITS